MIVCARSRLLCSLGHKQAAMIGDAGGGGGGASAANHTLQHFTLTNKSSNENTYYNLFPFNGACDWSAILAMLPKPPENMNCIMVYRSV